MLTPDLDAYTPAKITERVEAAGVSKAELAIMPTFVLALLAGAFIAFGAMLFTLIVTGSDLGFGPTRLLGGIGFSLGLILVVVAGAELFTGNNLIVMAWADGKVSTRRLMRNWAIVFVGNLIGGIAMAVMADLSGAFSMNAGAVGATAIAIAEAKIALPPLEAFVRGILCNALVCLAIWLCFAAHSVTDKILAIVFPIAAFVALGFANAYLIPAGYFAGADSVDLAGFIANMIPVTAGNIVGGSVGVALVYWVVYGRRNEGQDR